MFSISRLHAVMKEVPRKVFDAEVHAQGSDKYSKRLNSWSQLVAMIYAQLSGAASLRITEAAYNGQAQHHYHLGTGEVRRSTLADANRQRSPDPFAATARALMARAPRALRRDGAELLYLLDSTSFTLTGAGFDTWTSANRSARTQGLKLHVRYDLGSEAPVHHSLSAPNVNDVTEGVKLTFERGACYVFDKGYCDYNWWAAIDAQGATFVTRFKRNAALIVEAARPIAKADAGTILADEIVHFAHKAPRGGKRNHYAKPLRRITIARPDKDTPLVLATNDLAAPATLIGQRYKDRWQIELFFKWIKQHLKIKQWLGRSENAVKIQILCALIAYLLLALYRRAHGIKTSLWVMLGELRTTLFQRPVTDAVVQRRRQQDRTALRRLQAELFA